MAKYHNVMENLVEEQVDKVLATTDCCKCERCREDIIAYALNQLPPKYVVTDEGAIYSKVYILGNQHVTDVLTAITQGINIVSRYPRH